jgi:hypothetical protein
MSNHILHQFDEAWLAEITQVDEARQEEQICNSLNERYQRRLGDRFLSSLSVRELVVLTAAFLVAVAAFYYSVQANRRADELQRRITIVESELRGAAGKSSSNKMGQVD